MSWIVRDLWSSLEARQDEYSSLLEKDRMRAYEAISRIAYEVGEHYGVLLQLNFPPGRYSPQLKRIGHRDLSILIHRGQEAFAPVSEAQVKKIFERLNPLSFEALKRDQEGFKARLSEGRIDCLPGGVHLWCEITSEVLDVLDWLFSNAYGLVPP